MRFLHTSDWHIGKKFHQVDLLENQALFFEWLVQVAVSEKVDCVLVSGDIFDRATPKGDAVILADDVFSKLLQVGVSVVAISGNHDSAERLYFGSKAMGSAGLHIRTERPHLSEIGIPITIKSKLGDEVQVLPIPYLDPQRINLEDGVERRHDSVLQAVIAHQMNLIIDPSRCIIMSHAFVTGGAESDSERPLSVGGTPQIPASSFDGFGYVALGHLHRPQTLGSGNIFYSGSPLPYSFSEEHEKSVRIVDVDQKITSNEIKIDVGMGVVTITDTLENLLKSSKYIKAEDSFVRAILTDSSIQPLAMDKLRERFSQILEVGQQAMKQQGILSGEDARRSVQRNPKQVVDQYVADTFEETLEDHVTEFINSAISESIQAANS